jgi:hypothetical protein
VPRHRAPADASAKGDSGNQVKPKTAKKAAIDNTNDERFDERFDERLERIGAIVRKERKPEDAFERVIAAFYPIMGGAIVDEAAIVRDLAALEDEDVAFAAYLGSRLLAGTSAKIDARAKPGSSEHIQLTPVRDRLGDFLQKYLEPRARTPATQAIADKIAYAVPSSVAFRALLAALNNVQNLQRGDDGWPNYTYDQSRSAESALVSFRPPATLAADTVDQFVAFLCSAPEITVDVLIIALDWWRQRRDENGSAWITADGILKERGIVPKTKDGRVVGWRPDELLEIEHAMLTLDSAWLKIEHKVVADSTKRKPRNVREMQHSRFLAVLDHRVRTVDDKPTQVAWRYGFGQWVDLWPFDNVFALASRSFVRYHPFRKLWERRLGLYAVLHLRIAGPTGSRRIQRKIGTLLEHAGLSAAIDLRNPQRSLQRLRVALRNLTKDGHFGGWAIDGVRDEDLDAYFSRTLPARGWWDTIESLVLTIEGASLDGPLFDSENVPALPA